MKKISIFLCILFICTVSHEVSAFDSVEKATDSPSEKFYKSLLRQQAVEREADEEALKQKKKEKDKLLTELSAKRLAAEEVAKQRHLKDEEDRLKAKAEQDEIDAQYEAEEEALQKQCGSDYKNLKIGMKIDRVQKCVAEFFLRGQVKTKNGVVDHYSRDGKHLYVKNGRVVAWGN